MLTGELASPFMRRWKAGEGNEGLFNYIYIDSGIGTAVPPAVDTMAVQADGMIIVGGALNAVGPSSRSGLARFESVKGKVDTSYAPVLNGFSTAAPRVFSCVLQPDGKLVIGGTFAKVGGVTRNNMARLNPDGSLDTSFNPNVSYYDTGSQKEVPALVEVQSIALQVNGKMIISGRFTSVGGTTQKYLARLNANGSLDTTFVPVVDGVVGSIALDKAGRCLASGAFNHVNGVSKIGVVRFFNDAAQSTLSMPDSSTVTWLRGGSAPETTFVQFDASADGGLTWTSLGKGTRLSGNTGWRLTGVTLPQGPSVALRAHAPAVAGFYNGSTSLIQETTTLVPDLAVELPVGNGLTSGVSTVDCGRVAVSSSGIQIFTLRNTGTGALTNLDATIDGPNAADFILAKAGLGTTLVPGDATTLTVVFDPTVTGSLTATLHITSNDPDENPFDIALTGTGTAGIAFDRSLNTVGEEAGTVQINLVRTGGTAGAMSVRVDSSTGTATSADYTPVVNYRVNFADGQAAATVPVTITLNPEAEPNEEFTLRLSDPQGNAELGVPSMTTIRIIDNIDTTRPTVTMTSPASGTTLTEGMQVNVSGSATDDKGVAKVQFSLNGAAFTDALINLNSTATSATYTASLSPLVPRLNTLAVKSIDTRGNESTVVTRTFYSIVKRPLVVNKVGTGTLTAPFPGTDATKQVGYPYTLKATPGTGQVFNGWTASSTTGTGLTAEAMELPSITFTHQENLVLTANFIANPFTPAVIGKFNGLAQPSATVPAGGTVASKSTVGGFTATVTNTGSFTGTLKMDGLSLAVAGIFDNSGVARFGTARAKSVQLTRAGKPPMEVALTLDMTGTTGVLSGTVKTKTRVGDMDALSDIVADRAAYSTASKASSSIAGTTSKAYTMVFKHQAPPSGWATADVPQGDGYATGTIKPDGSVSFTGKLADHTAISVSTALSKTHAWPWFSQLYSLGGSFAALVAVNTADTETDLTASGVHWFRPWQNVQWYPWGWIEGISVDVLGSAYAPPALLGLLPVDGLNGNATLQWSDGLLTSAVTRNLNLHPTTSAVTRAPTTDASFTTVLTTATGLITGTFTHTNTTKPSWQGVLFQKGANKGGYGYFMTTAPKVMDGMGESGGVRLLAK